MSKSGRRAVPRDGPFFMPGRLSLTSGQDRAFPQHRTHKLIDHDGGHDQGGQHVVEQVLTVEDGDQQPHSVPLQLSERIEKRTAIGGLDERFDGLTAPGEPSQPSKTGKVVRGGVGVA